MELATNPLDIAAIARRARRGNGGSTPPPSLNAITTELANVPPLDPITDESGNTIFTDP